MCECHRSTSTKVFRRSTANRAVLRIVNGSSTMTAAAAAATTTTTTTTTTTITTNRLISRVKHEYERSIVDIPGLGTCYPDNSEIRLNCELRVQATRQFRHFLFTPS